MLDVALDRLRSGLCVLPAILAEKRPALTGWKQYQRRLPTEQQVRTWFVDAPTLCLLTGAASGGLEMIDFDLEGELFERWRELVDEEYPGLFDRLVVERSQSGGRHVVYRCEATVPGSSKLAQRILVAPSGNPVVIAGKTYIPRRAGDRFEVTVTLIETRGEGGLFLCAPSPGYALEHGRFDRLPKLTESERAVLIETACVLNEVTPPATESLYSATICGRPGDDFNERGDVRAILHRHRWTLARSGANEHWRRPGKERGCSATLKNGVFYVFSSNAAPFEPARAYAPFAVYALLEHAGDFAKAAAALRAEGYGEDASGEVVDLSHIICAQTEPVVEPPEA
ncbi:MAG TPA: bifunctional DNA primase/polymerase, partial [Pirellulales bacterium]